MRDMSRACRRSTLPRLVPEAVALVFSVGLWLLPLVVPLTVEPPDANRCPPSVLGCAFVASLRLRLASAKRKRISGLEPL